MLNDPISDMITRVRNSALKLNKEVSFPFSKFKWSITEKMRSLGYFSEVWTNRDKTKIRAKIRFFNKAVSVSKIVRVSKPSQRIYLTKKEIERSCVGKKTYFLTTSLGILTHRETISKKIGGELMFFIS